MTLKDLLTSDIKAVFMNSDDFADVFTNARTATSISVIFDKEFVVVIDDVEASTPAITCADTDVPGIAHGDLFTNEDTAIVYNVTGIQPDGTGITLVTLTLN